MKAKGISLTLEDDSARFLFEGAWVIVRIENDHLYIKGSGHLLINPVSPSAVEIAVESQGGKNA